jgi:tRNA dimethylallyltransferase
VTRACSTLYFIAGVTSSGKTNLALDWAEENGAEILSCDSVAIYKGMDVGSAKPTVAERKRVVHHGLDLVSVGERYDVSQYLNYAKEVILDAYSRKSKILVVGGSGFYLRSFFASVVDGVSVSTEIKNSVDKTYQVHGLDGLLKELKLLNPMGLGELDQSNPIRLIKSLERCLASGLSIVELKEEFSKKPIPYSDFQKKTCLVDRENSELEKLIQKRTKLMLSNGLIEEVQGLIEQGLSKNYPASNAIGYRQTLSYLGGKGTKEDLIQNINVSTRQLVAKQRKWFRKYYNSNQNITPGNGQGLCVSDLNWTADT